MILTLIEPRHASAHSLPSRMSVAPVASRGAFEILPGEHETSSMHKIQDCTDDPEANDGVLARDVSSATRCKRDRLCGSLGWRSLNRHSFAGAT